MGIFGGDGKTMVAAIITVSACGIIALVSLYFQTSTQNPLSATVTFTPQLDELLATNRALQQKLESITQNLAAARRSAECVCNTTALQVATNDVQVKDDSEKTETKTPTVAPYWPQETRDVMDWEAFDTKYVYSWKRYWQVMSHAGISQKEIQEAVKEGERLLSAQSETGYRWIHGNLRVHRLRGTEYLLDYTKKGSKGETIYKRVNVLRPFAQIQAQVTDAKFNEPLYFILPLSDGRREMFVQFADQLKRFALGQNRPPMHLTIVYFLGNVKKQEDSADLKDCKTRLGQLSRNNGLQYRLLFKDEDFSRGGGLEAGARSLDASSGNHLLFFVDVDMKFSENFLARCRATPEAGTSAYFPIVFSKFKDSPWSGVSHASGAWRNYGLGMVCLYLSDFLSLDGYSKTIKGWGGEDVDFFLRMLKQKKVEVVRAVDEGIMHEWHPKTCSPTLTSTQMDDCLGSMADWEGSKKSIGLRMIKAERKVAALEKQLHGK